MQPLPAISCMRRCGLVRASRRQELRDYLLSRRARTSPQQVGLPTSAAAPA